MSFSCFSTFVMVLVKYNPGQIWMQVCSGLWGKTIDMRRLFDLDMKAEDQVQPPRIPMVTLLFPEFLFRFLEDFYSLPIMILYIPNDQRASSGIQLIAVSLSADPRDWTPASLCVLHVIQHLGVTPEIRAHTDTPTTHTPAPVNSTGTSR